MRFRSRISIIIPLIVLGSLGVALYQTIQAREPEGIISIVLAMLLFTVLYAGTCYVIEGETLYVRVLPFTRGMAYDLTKLVSISATRSLISSPALSLRRIRLDFGVGRPLIISPASQELFIAEIQRINPKVVINL